MINVYIVYELHDWEKNPINAFLIKNRLFHKVKLKCKKVYFLSFHHNGDVSYLNDK